MNITFENQAEAFAAIATVVISADKIGTLEEKKFLFENVKGLDIFDEYNDDEFINLMVNVNKKVYQIVPLDNFAISQEGIFQLCSAIKEVLASKHFEKAYSMACELACSDGLVESEKILLNQIHTELGIDSSVAREIMNRANQSG